MQLIDPKLIDPNPFQSRQSMDGDDLKLLAEDIKARGLLQPPTVRPHPGVEGLNLGSHYQLAFGHRRHAAWLIARPGEPMPVNIMDLDNRQMFEYAAVAQYHGQRRRDEALLKKYQAWLELEKENQHATDRPETH